MPNAFPLVEDTSECNVWDDNQGRETYVHHRMAELPSAFRVSSTPSSRPTGSIDTEQMPMITIMAKRPPVLSGFTEKN